MQSLKRYVLPALAVSAVAALPAPAMARGGGGERAEGGRDGNVPSRVADRLRRAAKAIDRAEERADDGQTDGAITALSSARKSLASALKSAQRRVSTESGPAAIGAVVRAHHRTVATTVNMLDGTTGPLDDAIAQTLKAALDGRDSAIASVVALEDGSDYSHVMGRVVDATGDEGEAISEALGDDELSAVSKSALESAATQVKATGAAAQAEAGTDSGDDAGFAGDSAEDRDGEDCPRGDRPPPPEGERGPRPE
jgi:hypothetical protein